MGQTGSAKAGASTFFVQISILVIY